MTVLIIEDERPAADKIKKLLLKIDPEIEIPDILETVESSVKWLRENPSPDLILMDIQLNDGVSFEIFSIVKIDTPVIFTTAYDEYAIQAFKVNSIDYLLKPIELDSLASAISKYKSLFHQKNTNYERIAQITETLTNNHKTRFLVKVGLHYSSITINNIECFYICERSTFLQTFDQKSFDIDYSLEQIESLVDPDIFFRINRNYIININAISKIISYSTNRLKLELINNSDNKEIIVSRDKVSEFKEWLNR